PPPCGWSTGFMAEPRTVGRLPLQRLRPALPPVTFSWSTLPTWPTVARQASGTRRISPEGRRRTPKPSSFATSWTARPAGRAVLQLGVVDQRAGRDVRERQRVAGTDVGAGAGLDRRADTQARGSEDVRLRAVGVMQQRDARRPVRVVLDRCHLRRNAVLGALEVDLPVEALVPAALVAPRNAPVRVPATA